MPVITSAGAGSGLDLESVISSSVNARRAQLLQPITNKQNSTQITLSGVGQLKSAISSFVSSLKDLAKEDGLNKRAINIVQAKDNPTLKVEAKGSISNGQYDIAVEQLAKSSVLKGAFDSSTVPVVNQDGKLTFSAGDKQFDVELKAGDSLQTLRKKINNQAGNFGLSVNILNTADGKSQLVVDAGITGEGKDLKISSDNSALQNDFINKLKVSQTAQNAKIRVNGDELVSTNNTFDGTIEGLKITALKESERSSQEGVSSFKSNKVEITSDKAALNSVVKGFVDGYNSLLKKANELGKHNSIVAGRNQNDGGPLAGDSTPKAITSLMARELVEGHRLDGETITIFQFGIKMDNKGVLSFDERKFSEAVEKNPDKFNKMFSGPEGLSGKLAKRLDDYSQSGGILAKREDSLNSVLKEVSRKQSDAVGEMTKYEVNLRARYASLDKQLARLNKSASYLNLLNTERVK